MARTGKQQNHQQISDLLELIARHKRLALEAISAGDEYMHSFHNTKIAEYTDEFRTLTGLQNAHIKFQMDA